MEKSTLPFPTNSYTPDTFHIGKSGARQYNTL
jgi:hypothetical protein